MGKFIKYGKKLLPYIGLGAVAGYGSKRAGDGVEKAMVWVGLVLAVWAAWKVWRSLKG